jgi:hypothetical protein
MTTNASYQAPTVAGLAPAVNPKFVFDFDVENNVNRSHRSVVAHQERLGPTVAVLGSRDFSSMREPQSELEDEDSLPGEFMPSAKRQKINGEQDLSWKDVTESPGPCNVFTSLTLKEAIARAHVSPATSPAMEYAGFVLSHWLDVEVQTNILKIISRPGAQRFYNICWVLVNQQKPILRLPHSFRLESAISRRSTWHGKTK